MALSTEEDIIVKFFDNINLTPQKKDYYVRDFEDYYFKARPKFSQKLIKILIEVLHLSFNYLILGRPHVKHSRTAFINQ